MGLAMRARELELKELLEMDAEGGVIRFAAQRVLLLDAAAMGLRRTYLVEDFGRPQFVGPSQ
jgi:two-component system, NtrC family, response regulator HydG